MSSSGGDVPDLPDLQTKPPPELPLNAPVELSDTENLGEQPAHSPTQAEQWTPPPLPPLQGAWAKRINIIPELLEADSPKPPPVVDSSSNRFVIPPPALKEDGQFRFPWAAKMNPKLRNLHRVTSPTYLEDGTPMIEIPNHVLLKGLENQKEYVIGQFFRCKTPSGGLVHAVASRIWGKNGKIFTRKLGESSFLFHIPNASTRAWVLQRGLWHVDECLMFVAPWTPEATLAMPEITSVPVWVTLDNIPSCLYSLEGISFVGSGLGEPVVTEKPRLDPSLMGKAKVLVEIELDKGFPHRIGTRDEKGIVSLVDVEYSWIPSRCNRCGQIGHKESRCLHLTSDTVNQDSVHASAPSGLEKDVGATKSDPIIAATAPISSSPITDTLIPQVEDLIPPICSVVSPNVEAVPTSPTVSSPILDNITALENANTTVSTDLPQITSPISTLPQAYEDEQEQECVFGDNHFGAFNSGVYEGYEIGDFSVKTRGGRQTKPTFKVQEQWTVVGKRGRRGRGGRGRHGPPS